MSHKIIKRLITGVSITSAGAEIANIIGPTAFPMNGFVQQIIFQQVSGTATTLPLIQIRYESGNNHSTHLVYSAVSSSLSSSVFSDSEINAPFDLGAPDPYSDLILYAQSDATGVFDIRIDIEVL